MDWSAEADSSPMPAPTTTPPNGRKLKVGGRIWKSRPIGLDSHTR